MEKVILDDVGKGSPPISYGFYVGGMKKTALNETETKQVVLATYSMAQEALDIKTLSILILCSSKTDIVQSVGRILRSKGDTPKIVVDIIDPNSTFEAQWKKRLAYYRKCDYSVYKVDKWTDYVALPFNDMEAEPKKWKQMWPKPNKKGVAKCVVDDGDSDDEDEAKNSECLISL
jgi:superfamily II DNA or RNA helicase